MKSQLVAALEESLHDVPDPADVLAGVRAGIARRRRRRRTGALLGIVALVLVMMTTSVVRPNVVPAGPIRVGDWISTLELGWIPDGMTRSGAQVRLTDESIHYQSAGASLTVTVDKVDQVRSLDLPGWQPIDVNGRQGRVAADADSAVVVFPLPSGRWVAVSLGPLPPTGGPPGPDYRADALRVAGAVRETAANAVRVGFAPTYLPPRQRIIGVRGELPSRDGYGALLFASGSLQLRERSPEYSAVGGLVEERRRPDLGPGVEIALVPSDLLSDLTAEGDVRIADIQGRPAYLTFDRQAVKVTDFHGGTLVVVATLDRQLAPSPRVPSPEAVQPEELIKVAEGVRWIG